jgi:hypothetical protein
VSCGLHDVVALEARGVPSALVATDVFTPESEAQSRLLGQPEQRPIEVPHPIQPVPIERVVGYAATVLDEVVARLTG